MGLPTGIVSGLTNFTVAAWVKLTSVSTNMRIFDFGTSTTNYMEMTPKHSNSVGKIQFYIRTSSTTKSVTGTAASAYWKLAARCRDSVRPDLDALRSGRSGRPDNQLLHQPEQPGIDHQ